MIHANPGGYDNLALVRFSEVPLQDFDQLIRRHFVVLSSDRDTVAQVNKLIAILFFALLRLI